MKHCLSFLLVFILLLPCSAQERAEVLLETTEGNIRIELYNETPQHRDNFMKLVKMQVFDSLLFHRVIKDFMIQGGDLNSKHAQPGQRLGSGELDYTIEPEFRLPQIFHRRGVVAMAREGDARNPERRSSACQFYIVWGKTYSTKELEAIQEKVLENTKGQTRFSSEMYWTYKKRGGSPHLDGQYTVFGEVTEGLDVVEKIQKVFTDDYNRPVDDVRIIRARRIKR